MVPELKPCPFCGIGGSWRSWGTLDDRENIFKCGNPKCPVQPKTISFATRDEALEVWNTRCE